MTRCDEGFARTLPLHAAHARCALRLPIRSILYVSPGGGVNVNNLATSVTRGRERTTLRASARRRATVQASKSSLRCVRPAPQHVRSTVYRARPPHSTNEVATQLCEFESTPLRHASAATSGPSHAYHQPSFPPCEPLLPSSALPQTPPAFCARSPSHCLEALSTF